jgi:hypothetical protein
MKLDERVWRAVKGKGQWYVIHWTQARLAATDAGFFALDAMPAELHPGHRGVIDEHRRWFDQFDQEDGSVSRP